MNPTAWIDKRLELLGDHIVERLTAELGNQTDEIVDRVGSVTNTLLDKFLAIIKTFIPRLPFT